MGLFDTVRCRYPLPHNQDAEFQTKDLANLVAGEPMLGGLMDEYEITVEGGLRLHAHEREYVKDQGPRLAGTSSRSATGGMCPTFTATFGSIQATRSTAFAVWSSFASASRMASAGCEGTRARRAVVVGSANSRCSLGSVTGRSAVRR